MTAITPEALAAVLHRTRYQNPAVYRRTAAYCRRHHGDDVRLHCIMRFYQIVDLTLRGRYDVQPELTTIATTLSRSGHGEEAVMVCLSNARIHLETHQLQEALACCSEAIRYIRMHRLDASWINAVHAVRGSILIQTDDTHGARLHFLKAARSHPPLMDIQYADVVASLVFNANIADSLPDDSPLIALIIERLFRSPFIAARLRVMLAWASNRTAARDIAHATDVLREAVLAADVAELVSLAQWSLITLIQNSIAQKDLEEAARLLADLQRRQRGGTTPVLKAVTLYMRVTLAVNANDTAEAIRLERLIRTFLRRHTITRDFHRMLMIARIRCLEMTGQAQKARDVHAAMADRPANSIEDLLVYGPPVLHLRNEAGTMPSASNYLADILRSAPRIRNASSAVSNSLLRTMYEGLEASPVSPASVLNDAQFARIQHDAKYVLSDVRDTIASVRADVHAPSSKLRLTSSIRGLIDLFNDARRTFAAADIARLCSAIVDARFPDDRDRIRVTSPSAPADGRVRIPTDVVRSVLFNLMGNAIRHSPPSTPIIVAITTSEAALHVSVRNQCAIDPHLALGRITECLRMPLALHPASGAVASAHGRGLALVGMALNEHGSTIEARLVNSTTVEFYVTLPYDAPQGERYGKIM